MPTVPLYLHMYIGKNLYNIIFTMLNTTYKRSVMLRVVYKNRVQPK